MRPILNKIQDSLKPFLFPAPLQKLSLRLFKKRGSSEAESAPIVGCDFGKSKVVLLQIEKSSPKIRVVKFQKITRGAANGQKDAEFLKKCFESGGFSARRLRISVKGQGVILRFVQFPQMKHEELRNAVSFEIDQYIPFKAHEVVWDLCVLEENVSLASGAKGMNVLLVAVKREDLNAYLQVFQEAGLQIELIDIDALAVINALEFFHPQSVQTTAGILDVGTEISTLSITQKGKPRFIRDISYGTLDIVKRLKRKLGLSQEQAEEQLAGDNPPSPEALAVIQEGLGDLISELRVSLNYYLDQVPSAESIQALFVTGGVVRHHAVFLGNFKNDLGFAVEPFDLVSKIEAASSIDPEMLKQNQGILPVAMGLCLRA